MRRSIGGGIAGAMLLVALSQMGGCSAGKQASSSSGNGSGASDGGGAAGGTSSDGGGGASLCDGDCALIETPDCHVAVCNDGMYPGPIGSCVVVPGDDGAACDDGQFCTLDDSCMAGVCSGSMPNDCGLVPDPCEVVSCDEASKSCATSPVADGEACSTGDLCVVGATCSNGLCIGGVPNECFFEPVPNECHVSQCNPTTGMCEPVPGNNGVGCVDPADLCTTGKTCLSGVCGGGAPVNCSHLTSGCNLGVCDAGTGQCTTMAVMNGQACDDLDACTLGETCSNQVCGGGSAVTTCSQTGDGCCPSNCTAQNDIDCACSNGALSTPFNQNNGLAGNMFDVTAVKNIEVQSVDVNLGPSATTVEIWYRPGTYVGHENSPTGWTLAGSASVTGAGINVPTPVPAALSIHIPAGQTYGFYVTTTGGTMYYTDGTAVGNIAASNADLQIKQGAGKSYPFGTSTFTTRVWNGVIHYQQCGN